MQGVIGQDQGAPTGPGQSKMYALRRYNPKPEWPNGSLYGRSQDLESLKGQCDLYNKQSALDDGFKQWWITDGQGKIIYPLETKSSVYTSPAAESDEVSQSFQEMRAFRSASALHDFLFLTKDVDEQVKAERLCSLASELELTAEHLRKLLELEQR
ncbi:hypothetical protein [Deinococcus humi]|uniref:Uncharacterized protein n=1 Tax=Deinococcus humi TaxID=662880 RepID=A0A7W8NIX7_9DEIO|nr:hypothetical protein [Deinococcus humi]MBB5366298.1 hypothetical protein [Deinococcus humi]GGO33546.1 hypothetical protein GCM10008949_32900 [Deinococcus humi]